MSLEHLQAPEHCASLEDIRRAIDALDRAIIALLGQRFEYVKAAATFKTSETSVRAPMRLQSMLAERQLWAKEEGLDPDVIERMYINLVNHFIEREMAQWKNQ